MFLLLTIAVFTVAGIVEWIVMDRIDKRMEEGRKAMLELSIKTNTNLFRLLGD